MNKKTSEYTTKKKHFFGMNIGSASILLIFVILCLVSFAALSIISANADRKLTDKLSDRTIAYYEASNQAYSSLAEIDKTLKNQYNLSDSAEGYFQTVGHNKAYTIPISDSQTLFVRVEILYPENENDTYYRILNWQVLSE